MGIHNVMGQTYKLIEIKFDVHKIVRPKVKEEELCSLLRVSPRE
jgi:hypothetical protein